MAKRQDPKRKTPTEILDDLRTGCREAAGHGPAQVQRYLEKVLSAQGSVPNAVKFFAYDFLAEACYQQGDEVRGLEAIAASMRYMPAAQEEARQDFERYLPELRFCERGISIHADAGNIDQALALCDVAISLGLGREYEAKRHSLERRL